MNGKIASAGRHRVVVCIVERCSFLQRTRISIFLTSTTACPFRLLDASCWKVHIIPASVICIHLPAKILRIILKRCVISRFNWLNWFSVNLFFLNLQYIHRRKKRSANIISVWWRSWKLCMTTRIWSRSRKMLFSLSLKKKKKERKSERANRWDLRDGEGND